MTTKLQIQKILLKIQYVDLELQETLQFFDTYNESFSKEFREELAFLNSIQIVQKIPNETEGDPLPQPSSLAQKIYRNLAKKMHPDVSAIPNAEHEFKKLSNFYENDDLIGIISLANSHNLKVMNLAAEDIEIMEKKILQVENKIKEKKTTIAWKWATSTEDKEKLKEAVYRILNLDKEEFEKWKMEAAGIEPAS